MSNVLLVGLLKHARFPDDIVSEVYASHERAYGCALMCNPAFALYARELVANNTFSEYRRSLVRTRTREALDAVLDSRESTNLVLGAIVEAWKLGPKDQMRFVQRKLTSSMAHWVRYESKFGDEAKAYERANFGMGSARRFEGQWCRSASEGESELRADYDRDFSIPARAPAILNTTLAELNRRTMTSDELAYAATRIVSVQLGRKNDATTTNVWRNFMFLVDSAPEATLHAALETARALAMAE